MTQTPDRPRLNDLTSDQYDQLCTRLEKAEAAIERVRALVDDVDRRGVVSGYPFTVDAVRAALDVTG